MNVTQSLSQRQSLTSYHCGAVGRRLPAECCSSLRTLLCLNTVSNHWSLDGLSVVQVALDICACTGSLLDTLSSRAAAALGTCLHDCGRLRSTHLCCGLLSPRVLSCLCLCVCMCVVYHGIWQVCAAYLQPDFCLLALGMLGCGCCYTISTTLNTQPQWAHTTASQNTPPHIQCAASPH